MKILIVDDEPDIRDSLAEFFEDEGFTVERAANGREALTILESPELPRAVILDLRMPLMDGTELYRIMQADVRLASVPVIVSTSDPSQAPSGVLIMRKPINLARLLEAVRQYCA